MPRIHESVGPLLRGIGLTVILIGTIAGAIHAKMHTEARHTSAPVSKTTTEASHAAVPSQDSTLQALTQEVADLRETVQEETTVEEVLTSTWFEILGFVGSCITAASFYAEWLSKRSKPLS